MKKVFTFLRNEGVWKITAFTWVVAECGATFLFIADWTIHHSVPVSNPWVVLLVAPIVFSVAVAVVVSIHILGFQYIAARGREANEQRFLARLRKRAESLDRGRYDRHYVFRAVESIASEMGIPISRAKELALQEGMPYDVLRDWPIV